jgi:hypothetical protein
VPESPGMTTTAGAELRWRIGFAHREGDRGRGLVVDRVHQQHANQPVDQVRQALKTAWRQAAGKDLPEPTLTNAATQISQGKRVELRNAG